MVKRLACTGFLLAALLVSCGGGRMTVSEYAAEAERLVATMQADFAAIDASWESQAPSVEAARDYWDRRLDIRADFLDGVRDLNPPDEIAGQHATALDLFTRITEADEDLAAYASSMESVTEHRQWLDSPEGAAMEAVLEEVYAFCRASQEEYDATAERESFEETPWLPPEMKDVVKVAFGCPPESVTGD